MRRTVTAIRTAMRIVVLRIWQMQARGPPSAETSRLGGDTQPLASNLLYVFALLTYE